MRIPAMMKGLVAAAVMMVSGLAAEAATFKLSFTMRPSQYPLVVGFAGLPDRLLTATVEGTLQGDGNTVFVTAMSDLRIDGVLYGQTLDRILFYNQFTFPTAPGHAKLSLDGLNNDIYWINADGTRGIAFDSGRVGPQANQQVQASRDIAGTTPTGYYKQSLASSSYSLTVVPLPAGGLLLLTGLGLLVLRRKR